MKATVSDAGRAPNVPQRTAGGQPPPPKTKAPRKAGSPWWLVPALLLLVAIPLTFGAGYLIQLARGGPITPFTARFFASPLPVVLHIVSAAGYTLLGPFQFVTGFRRRWPGWHRVAGRLVVACGLLVGLSALWMAQFYPTPAGTGALLYALRLLFGAGMIGSIVLGFAAIRRGDVRRHRAWMIRAYALGLGAGTQVLTGTAGAVILGSPGVLSSDLLNGAAWVINLAVAEWIIRRRLARVPSGRARPAAADVPAARRAA